MYYYYEIKMPTQELFDYFNNNLKHSYFLNGVTYAKGVNEKLDAFINLSHDEICNYSFFDINAKIEDHIEQYNKTAAKYLRTKSSCAKIIQCSLKIEKYQKEILDRCKTRTGSGYHIDYYFASPDVFKDLRSYIDKTHTIIENLKKRDIDNNFKENALKVFEHKVKDYYGVFNLDYTPIKQKVEEKTMDCGLSVLSFILFVFLFWLLVKCACG